MASSKRRLPRGARERAATVVERLAAEYPDAACALVHDGPLQLLVATILSAQCTDERVNLVTPGLFRRYPDAVALAEADPAELEELIRSTGFFHAKARAIIAMSEEVVARFGGRVPDRMEDLVTLRGVGRKTANVVLGVAFGKPGFAVDTHVTRLTGRLKLTSSTDPVEIETDVCSMVPAGSVRSLRNVSQLRPRSGRRRVVPGRPDPGLSRQADTESHPHGQQPARYRARKQRASWSNSMARTAWLKSGGPNRSTNG